MCSVEFDFKEYIFVGFVILSVMTLVFSLMTCCLIETESESLSVTEMHVETCRVW